MISKLVGHTVSPIMTSSDVIWAISREIINCKKLMAPTSCSAATTVDTDANKI